MYQLTEDPDVVCLLTPHDETRVARGTWLWRNYEEWCAGGNNADPVPELAPPFLPNSPAHHRAIRDAAWKWMASIVMERGYDSIETCCSYYNSSVERYRREARAMVAWRDAVNQALEALVLNPPVGVDTWEEVCPLLPQPGVFNWPVKVDLPLFAPEAPVTLSVA
jgi:hypothetical protein